MDAPRTLKLQYGQRSVAVEYTAESGGGTGGSVSKDTKDHSVNRSEDSKPIAADSSKTDRATRASKPGTHKEITTKEGRVTREILFPERPEDARRLTELISSGQVETMHSQEASLEQIFIKLTGRGLA
jgi:ABC-type uncharacterized transport system ATPase subunit